MSDRESRRDEEDEGELDSHKEGGGAGPSREPRTVQEHEGQTGLGKLDCPLFLLFPNSCATDIVFVTLLRIAVETAFAEYTSCLAMARSPPP